MTFIDAAQAVSVDTNGGTHRIHCLSAAGKTEPSGRRCRILWNEPGVQVGGTAEAGFATR